MTDMLSFERAGARATITLNRPEKHNALEVDDLPALEELLVRADTEEGLRVLILTGTGDKSFCSGVAIGDIAGTDWRETPLGRLTARLERVRVPTIAALNGGVYGGAVDLALACDFRIGVSGMALSIPPAKLGIAYYAAGCRRLIDRLGLTAAKRLFLLADRLDAEELLSIGYLDELVAPDELALATDRLAVRIEALAPLSLATIKRVLNDIARDTLDEDEAADMVAACFDSEDAREGIAAFAEKRATVFKGR